MKLHVLLAHMPCMQAPAVQLASVVHSQAFGPLWQRPKTHESITVHGLPSVHATPVRGAWVHALLTHLSSVQASPSVQLASDVHAQMLKPETQEPAEHRSPAVQALPSSQLAVFGVNAHPVAGLQESSVQTFESSQTMVVLMHEPPEHTSFVQALPSSQLAVFGV
jgi:hypothetical protein